MQLTRQRLPTGYRGNVRLPLIARGYPAAADQYMFAGGKQEGCDQFEARSTLQELECHQEGGLIPVTAGKRHTEVLQLLLLFCAQGDGDGGKTVQSHRPLQLTCL